MLIKIRATPEADTERITKLKSDTYRIETRAKARDGQANRCVREILAEYFGCTVSDVRVVKGFQRPNKIIEIADECYSKQ